MTKWEEYNGSDEQIDEMCNALHGYMLRLQDGTVTEISIGGPYRDEATDTYLGLTITHYLICSPHPLAEMICQQSRTGQLVYCKKISSIGHEKDIQYFSQSGLRIDWGIPDTEYNLTPFDAAINWRNHE